MLSAWNKDDIAQQKNLDDLLSRKVTWNLNTAELVQAYRALVWMASLKDKIAQSQVEDIKLTLPEEKSQEVKPTRTKKSQA